jgi:hypothetical protein
MVFTFEFFRIRCSDNAPATLDRVLQNVPDLDAAKVRASAPYQPQHNTRPSTISSPNLSSFA